MSPSNPGGIGIYNGSCGQTIKGSGALVFFLENRSGGI